MTYNFKKPIKIDDLSKGEKVMYGLMIIHSYESDIEVSEAHDTFYAGGKKEGINPNMSDQDKKLMDRLGWFVNDSYESWQIWI